MRKIFLIKVMLAISTLAFAQVGIGTTSPTKTLDVNGELRIRVLPLGNETQELLVTDINGNMLKTTFKTQFDIGDIKYSYIAADHDGWYLLNGRTLTSLPINARTQATSLLGFSGTLPDTRGQYIKSSINPTTVGGLDGSETVELSQVNIPDFNFNTTIASAGAHTHTGTDNGNWAESGGGGLWGRGWNGSGGSPNSTIISSRNLFTRTTTAAGEHTHKVTLSSNGGKQAFNLTPAFIALNSFVYLGQ